MASNKKNQNQNLKQSNKNTDNSKSKTKSKKIKISFCGFGNMARAMAGGILKNKALAAKVQIQAYDPHPVKDVLGVTIQTNVNACLQSADVVFLAFKPQMLETALLPIRSELQEPIVISMLAGVSLDQISGLLKEQSELGISQSRHELKLVRIMPNINAVVGLSATGMYCSDNLSASDKKLITPIIHSFGSLVDVAKEDDLHAVTGLSGSGPAYVLEFVQGLIRGGVQSGLSAELAEQLALDTITGTLAMMKAQAKHPAELQQQVTSPAGTTIAGLAELADGGFMATTARAVLQATKRSRELGQSK